MRTSSWFGSFRTIMPSVYLSFYRSGRPFKCSSGVQMEVCMKIQQSCCGVTKKVMHHNPEHTFSSLESEHEDLERLFESHQRALIARDIDAALATITTFENQLKWHIGSSLRH